MSRQLPPLDLHAHVEPKIRPVNLERLGAVVFAVTRSLDEFDSVKDRRDQVTVWGVGCHPGVVKAQRDYDPVRFASLLSSTALVSEIGLDGRSKVPLEEQEWVFGSILSKLQSMPRIASIHSAGAPGRVLDALERTPIKGAVLHWWRGNEAQTRRAIERGYWFSFNAAGMKYANDVALVPLNRILTETDHPSGDRTSTAPRQPGAVDDVELALAEVYGIDVRAVRGQVWANIAALVDQTDVSHLLPTAVQRMVAVASRQEGHRG